MKEEYEFKSSYESIDTSEKPMANSISHWIKNVVNPNKVIDVGCGPGTYVYSINDRGLNAVGYDLDKRVKGKPFLENKSIFDIEDSADMVMCIEVAEHIQPEFSQNIVDKLYNILEKDAILLFTAACVGQGGTDHINNRPKEYWEHKFKEKGLIRCHTLEAQLEEYVKSNTYMGWFTANQMIFYKIDESQIISNAGSLIGPPQN
jgi:2-polyprenyl-3-methyl-5-hydroxy-6-metoxy-1,4-benzoquinol methylase